jgi:hypothetical protein
MFGFVEDEGDRLLEDEESEEQLVDWVLELELACLHNKPEENADLEATAFGGI